MLHPLSAILSKNILSHGTQPRPTYTAVVRPREAPSTTATHNEGKQIKIPKTFKLEKFVNPNKTDT